MRLINIEDEPLLKTVSVGGLSAKALWRLIKSQRTIKAIPIELYEQVKGERDVAIEQLKALNIELFEKPYLKAIPIEWIKKWLETCIPHYDYDRMTYIADVYEMLDDWEEENGN